MFYSITFTPLTVNTLGATSEDTLPVKYQPYVQSALSSYSGYTGYFVAANQRWITVVVMFPGFSITSYISGTTEYTAVGAVFAGYDTQTHTWDIKDCRQQASLGENFIGNVKYSTTRLYYKGLQLYPRHTTKNTWADWHIVPTSRPLVAPPNVKTAYVDAPGMDGALDYTEALSGVRFDSREGSWTFVVLRDDYDMPYQEWNVLYSEIMGFLHGRRMRVHLESDPHFFYYGRFFVDEWQSQKDYSTITIRYSIDPYKTPVNSTISEDWTWDDLFDTIIYYGTFDVNGEKRRNLINPLPDTMVPTIICSAEMTVTFGGYTYSLSVGTNVLSALTLQQGNNYMTFHGNGRVLVDYQTNNDVGVRAL